MSSSEDIDYADTDGEFPAGIRHNETIHPACSDDLDLFYTRNLSNSMTLFGELSLLLAAWS